MHIHMQVTTSVLQQPLQHAQVPARKFTDAQPVVIQEQKQSLQWDTVMHQRVIRHIVQPNTDSLDNAQDAELMHILMQVMHLQNMLKPQHKSDINVLLVAQ